MVWADAAVVRGAHDDALSGAVGQQQDLARSIGLERLLDAGLLQQCQQLLSPRLALGLLLILVDRVAALTAAAGEPQVLAAHKRPRQLAGQSNSFRVAPDHASAVLAVEPLPGWLELWMFRRTASGWTIDVLAPTTDGVDLGYVELAGWSSDGKRAVIVREARSDGAIHRTFQNLSLDSLAIDKQTSTLLGLGPARAWITPEWRGRTLALR